MKIVNLILSGGFGTRLWPLSTPEKPKQFLPLFKGKSLFQHTIERNKDLVDEYFVVTNQKQWQMAKPQYEEVCEMPLRSFLEPSPRNTAPAIGAACMCLDEEDVVLVSPSDHMIAGENYNESVRRAIALAKQGHLVTFGLQPTEPHTGYGYIEVENEEVLAFHEKPQADKAEEFINKGNYLWNSGMFAFKAGVFLAELRKSREDIFEGLNSLELENEVSKEAYAMVPEESIDYAVMEQSENIRCVSAHFQWYDLGSYEALFNFWKENKDYQPKQYQEIGEHQAFSNMKVNIISSKPQFLIHDNDVQIIIDKGRGQEVKSIFKHHYNHAN